MIQMQEIRLGNQLQIIVTLIWDCPPGEISAIIRKLVNFQYYTVSASEYRVNNTVSITQCYNLLINWHDILKWHGIIDTEFQNLQKKIKKNITPKVLGTIFKKIKNPYMGTSGGVIGRCPCRDFRFFWKLCPGLLV